MEPMDLDSPILFRLQCVNCHSYLSYPFKLETDTTENKQEIKIPRYKGDNINYHAENDYNSANKVLYSFIYCLKCHEKVGYWMSQASIKSKENINHIFFFKRCVNLIKYDKKKVTEEEDRKFKQEEIFYNSQFLTNDVINYAKEHIDNFIKNVEIFEKQRTEIKHCHDCFDRNIVTLKELFVNMIKNEGKNKLKLDINFTSKEISDAQKRNKLRIKKLQNNNKNNNNKNNNQEQGEDSKSNGKKINEKNELEENGQNIIENNINNIINDNGVDNKEDNGGEKNGLDSDEINELCNNLKSDIYLDDKIKQKNNSNNNKEPSKNVKNKKKNKKKK